MRSSSRKQHSSEQGLCAALLSVIYICVLHTAEQREGSAVGSASNLQEAAEDVGDT